MLVSWEKFHSSGQTLEIISDILKTFLSSTHFLTSGKSSWKCFLKNITSSYCLKHEKFPDFLSDQVCLCEEERFLCFYLRVSALCFTFTLLDFLSKKFQPVTLQRKHRGAASHLHRTVHVWSDKKQFRPAAHFNLHFQINKRFCIKSVDSGAEELVSSFHNIWISIRNTCSSV